MYIMATSTSNLRWSNLCHGSEFIRVLLVPLFQEWQKCIASPKMRTYVVRLDYVGRYVVPTGLV